MNKEPAVSKKHSTIRVPLIQIISIQVDSAD